MQSITLPSQARRRVTQPSGEPTMSSTRRLTAAQAIVEFLIVQTVERDGDEHRFFEGVLGIFGHGNVAGLGEARRADDAHVATERRCV